MGRRSDIMVKENEKTLSVKELSKRIGLTPRTIRYYEEIGVLKGIARDKNSHRIYNERDVHLVELVKRARHVGMSLEEIRELSTLLVENEAEEEFMHRSLQILRGHVRNLETKMHQLTTTKDMLTREIDKIESRLVKLKETKKEVES
jgi:DNA-binding transcriptional MerR regulator